MFERLLHIDRRYIFLLLFVGVLIARVNPFYLPIKSSSLVEGIWKKIEELPARAPVLLALDFDGASAPELDPATRAALRQIFRKNLRLISMTHWPTGRDLVVQIVDDIAAEFDDLAVEVVGAADGAKGVVNVGKRTASGALAWRPELAALNGVKAGAEAKVGEQTLRVVARTPTLEYGKDYVFLGTKAGEQVLVLTMGESIPTAFPTEPRTGKLTRELPIMEGVRSLKDVKYLLCVAAGASADWWIIYGAQKHKFAMGVACTAVMAPDLYVYYGTGQITGLAGGIKGSWEYEALIGTPGTAMKAVPAQTVAHMILIGLVLFCNVAYFMRGRGARP